MKRIRFGSQEVVRNSQMGRRFVFFFSAKVIMYYLQLVWFKLQSNKKKYMVPITGLRLHLRKVPKVEARNWEEHTIQYLDVYKKM